MTDDDASASVSAGQLRSIVERIERLEEEKKEVAEQIKEVYAEAKGNGFDTKTLRKIVAMRKKTPEERDEEAAMLDLYMGALGMDGTPLGDWAGTRRERPDVVPASKAGRALRKAVEAFGTPEPVSDADRAAGVAARFRQADGTGVSISFPRAAE